MHVKQFSPGRLYGFRLEAGLTQEDVSHRLRGLGFKATSRSVSRWEGGSNTPRAEVIPVLADVLGVRLDELFADDDDEESHPVAVSRAVNALVEVLLAAAAGGGRAAVAPAPHGERWSA